MAIAVQAGGMRVMLELDLAKLAEALAEAFVEALVGALAGGVLVRPLVYREHWWKHRGKTH